MAEIMKQGKCGDNLTWTLDNEGLLTISGEGEMKNYLFFDSPLNIKKVEISHGITSIGRGAFAGCKALTSIEIPNSVTEIGWHAFEGCKALTSIEFPNSVTSIGCSAFSRCKALTSIEIPNSVTSIGESAFYDCEALTSIEVVEDNANYASIDGVLYDKEKKTLIQCPGRKNNIEIPDSVTEIGYEAFSGCKALTNIEIPNSVTRIEEEAFSKCEALTNIEIPNSVTSIGLCAFYGCEALTNIEIPNSVTSIENGAFDGCKALTSIDVAEGNANYASIDGVLYDKEKKTLIQCPGRKNNIEIPNSVTKIGDFAFSGCKALTSIEIPNSVVSTGWSAFSGCKALTSIEIPNSVTSIEYGAFEGCKALTSIEIPNSVTSIRNRVFYNCTGLTSVTIPNSVGSITACAFCKYKGCVKTSVKNKNYKSINGSLLNKEGSEIIYAYMDKNANCSIPEGVEVIKKAAINNKKVKNIYLPITTITLEERAFCNAEIENLHIRCEHPEELKIHEKAFYNSNIENCTLYVPIGTGYAYRHHPVFSKFKEVVIEK